MKRRGFLKSLVSGGAAASVAATTGMVKSENATSPAAPSADEAYFNKEADFKWMRKVDPVTGAVEEVFDVRGKREKYRGTLNGSLEDRRATPVLEERGYVWPGEKDHK